jgi:hypothetical protein
MCAPNGLEGHRCRQTGDRAAGDHRQESIDGVEHVYSQTRGRWRDGDRALQGRHQSGDAAILRVHEKIRANMDRIPVGIPEPLIVGRGIDDVAIVVVTLAPKPGEPPRAGAPTT